MPENFADKHKEEHSNFEEKIENSCLRTNEKGVQRG